MRQQKKRKIIIIIIIKALKLLAMREFRTVLAEFENEAALTTDSLVV